MKQIKFTVAPVVTRLTTPGQLNGKLKTPTAKASASNKTIKANVKQATVNSDNLKQANVAIHHTPAVVASNPERLIVSGKVLESSTVNESIRGFYLPIDAGVSDTLVKHPELAKIVSVATVEAIRANVDATIKDSLLSYEELAITFERWLNDATSVDNRLAVMFEKLLKDAATASHKITSEVAKVLKDSGALSETIKFDLSSYVVDSPVLLEQLSKQVQRPLFDSAAMADEISAKPLLQKRDNVSLTEEIAFGVSFKERIAMAVSTLAVFGTYTKEQESVLVEQLSANLSKPIHDSSAVEDKLAIHVHLHLYDFVVGEEYLESLVVPEIQRWYDSDMTSEERLLAEFSKPTSINSDVLERLAIVFSMSKFDDLVSTQDIYSDISLLKTNISSATERLYVFVQRAVFENIQAQSTGQAIVQNYYATDYYWEDFHGSSHNSIG